MCIRGAYRNDFGGCRSSPLRTVWCLLSDDSVFRRTTFLSFVINGGGDADDDEGVGIMKVGRTRRRVDGQEEGGTDKKKA